MEIVYKKIGDIKPYENNPRKNDKAVEYVKRSMEQFGFRNHIVIDNDGVIVCGHTRYRTAKELGYKEVPCVTTEDLTDEQVRAFRLADNKVAEFAEWDFNLLDFELGEIEGLGDGIDMTEFGFALPFDDPGGPERDEDEQEYYGAERERTFNAVNLHDYDETRISGFYQFPKIEKEMYVPEGLIGFNYVLSTDEYDKGVHFYLDDYQFERIWDNPHKYMERLSRFACCLTPDFSLYTDMPIAMQIWNVYRSRLIGQIMQDNGIKVIPTLSWSGEASYDFCFDGIEPGGTVSVSTVGVMKSEEAKEIWHDGMREAMKRLKPSCVVLYGTENIDFDFGKCRTVVIPARGFSR